MMAKVIMRCWYDYQLKKKGELRGEVELIILKFYDTTNIQKYSEKVIWWMKAQRTKTWNMKNEKKRREMQKENEMKCKSKRNS